MITLEMRFVSKGREVSLEEVAAIIADHVARRILREIRQHTETLPRDQRSSPAPAPTSISEPKVVSVQDAAKFLGLGRSTICQYIQQKRIDVIRLGPRTTRIRMETINRIVRDGVLDRDGHNVAGKRE